MLWRKREREREIDHGRFYRKRRAERVDNETGGMVRSWAKIRLLKEYFAIARGRISPVAFPMVLPIQLPFARACGD